ncbi:hypothetical protein FIBSPDRAFT_821679 [Athelia psychrophila]|uniref:Nucleolus and neural progenitor protein-like N-terminal domain-containing protein n=1 Tax=Athelia psychrophila TaxID=1759441 RepID=A0A166NBW7_9AGAM|nr:hypothetical protein FIBSPDRAFT_821679 [Fibularhizoctonia sp. CBS 109695]
MPVRRNLRAPNVSFVPRDSLDPLHSGSIDAALKELRSGSRRLKAACSVFHDELKILERLYYKGKNQHRTSLFWKRAVELKRLCERLDGMNAFDMVEQLRCSFWGLAVRTNSKSLRGPWSHVPDTPSIVFILERLAACMALISKFNERAISISRSFKLAMQSGAFIQLVLTLLAICARMTALLPELQDSLQVSWAACHIVLQILDHDISKTIEPMKDSATGPDLVELNANSAQAVEFHDDNQDEDTGSFVPRPSAAHETEYQDVPTPVANYTETMPLPSKNTIAVAPSLVTSPAALPPIEQRSKPSTNKKNPSVKKKAKKAPKKDEIDDIFGF